MTGSRMIVVMLIAALVFVTYAGAAGAEDVTFTGCYDTGIGRYVAVSGDYAYVIDDNNGLVIVDVSDKISPAVTGCYSEV